MSRLARTVVLFLAAVLVLAACGGGEDAGDGGDGGDGAPAASQVAVTGTNSLAFEPSELTTSAGEITVALTAEDGVNHTFVVEDANGDVTVVEAAPGETASGTITLAAGTYTFYCDVPGHRDAGMEGTLTVTG